MTNQLSIVYDITQRCPMNCPICCMGARSGPEALEGELPLERKLSLMDEAAQVDRERGVHLDFSGGEIFTDLENVKVVERAAELLGRDKVGISSSGYQVDDALAARLSACAHECELTMDVPPGQPYRLRPMAYAQAAADAVPHLRRHGIEVGIQTVLARSNTNPENLTALYRWMCDNRVDRWSFLRFYPVGRARAFQDECLPVGREQWAIHFIRRLEREETGPHKPVIDFHYTMKGHSKSSSQCRCVRRSIGILPDGEVTACFWALDGGTQIVDPKYRLGSLREKSLPQILDGPAARYWTDCSHSCELGIA